MNPVIREAELTDLDALAALVSEIQALHVASRPETFRTSPADEIADWLRQLFQNPSVKLWVADLAGTVRGYIVVVTREQPQGPFNFARTWLELDQIGVQEGHRRTGIARTLVATALAYAGAQHISDVELTSWSFNREAHHAFSQLGFVPKVVRFESKQ
jgi:GNAT superfamily N-acetyltransferase